MAVAVATCNQIIGYLDELLDPTAYDDYGPDGLQVPGCEQIQTVVIAVSTHVDPCTRAREDSARRGPVATGPPACPFVRGERPFRQIKLRLSETRAIRSARCKQAGGTQLRWPFT